MHTIFNYCIEENNRLKNHTQEAFAWQQNYNLEILREVKSFTEIQNQIPTTISRQHIFEAFEQHEYYKAFVLIMLWGYIGLRPMTSKDKRATIAAKVFSCDKKMVGALFENIINAVAQNNLDKVRQIYNSLEKNGDKKITEVDTSYFTKILCFAAQSVGNPNMELLIYDKWTKLIHVHCLLDLKLNPLEYYSLTQLKKLYENGSTKMIYPRSNQTWESYNNYCNTMKNLANALSQEMQMATPLTAFQLEGFLFGQTLKSSSNKTDANPRYWIQQNFAQHYLPNLGVK